MNKIKTIWANDCGDLDLQVNAFCESHQVFATQTHYSRVDGLQDSFVAILFYKE